MRVNRLDFDVVRVIWLVCRATDRNSHARNNDMRKTQFFTFPRPAEANALAQRTSFRHKKERVFTLPL